MEKVQLKCVKIGSKLRVRITTPGYYNKKQKLKLLIHSKKNLKYLKIRYQTNVP